MQVSIQKPEPPKVFQPFSLTITFQSQEEVDQFYALHNVVRLNEATPAISHSAIRNRLEEGCGRVGGEAYSRVYESIKKTSLL